MPAHEDDVSLTIDGRTVKVTRPGKVLFPADEITKRISSTTTGASPRSWSGICAVGR